MGKTRKKSKYSKRLIRMEEANSETKMQIIKEKQLI